MNQLIEYIARRGITQSALAARIGVSRGYMSQILSGARIPSHRIIVRIADVTEGAVPPSAWFDISEQVAREAAE